LMSHKRSDTVGEPQAMVYPRICSTGLNDLICKI
jgi:hypothetical protein